MFIPKLGKIWPVLTIVGALLAWGGNLRPEPMVIKQEVKVPVEINASKSEITVAKIFGRSTGCQNAPVDLIRQVANAADNHHLPAQLVASIVAQESQCHSDAVSSKGAVGLMQVRVSVWSKNFDFGNKDNLFNWNCRE